MAHHLVDKMMKELSRHFAKDYIKLVFPNAEFKLKSITSGDELIVKSKFIDSKLSVLEERKLAFRTGKKNELIHLEFKLKFDKNTSKQIFQDAGALTFIYGGDVTSILILIKEPPAKYLTQLNRYEVQAFGESTNRFQYRVIKMWEYRDAILAGDIRFISLVPLLLDMSSSVDESLLETQRALIELEADKTRRVELLGASWVLASRHFPLEVLKKYFKEGMAMLELLNEVPEIKKLLDQKLNQMAKEATKQAEEKGRKKGIKEGIKEGIEKGIKEGERRVYIKLIIDTLSNSFGQLDAKSIRLLNGIEDLGILQKLFKQANQVSSLDAFREILNSIIKD